jgi:hypothetical protein
MAKVRNIKNNSRLKSLPGFSNYLENLDDDLDIPNINVESLLASWNKLQSGATAQAEFNDNDDPKVKSRIISYLSRKGNDVNAEHVSYLSNILNQLTSLESGKGKNKRYQVVTDNFDRFMASNTDPAASVRDLNDCLQYMHENGVPLAGKTTRETLRGNKEPSNLQSLMALNPNQLSNTAQILRTLVPLKLTNDRFKQVINGINTRQLNGKPDLTLQETTAICNTIEKMPKTLFSRNKISVADNLVKLIDKPEKATVLAALDPLTQQRFDEVMSHDFPPEKAASIAGCITAMQAKQVEITPNFKNIAALQTAELDGMARLLQKIEPSKRQGINLAKPGALFQPNKLSQNRFDVLVENAHQLLNPNTTAANEDLDTPKIDAIANYLNIMDGSDLKLTSDKNRLANLMSKPANQIEGINKVLAQLGKDKMTLSTVFSDAVIGTSLAAGTVAGVAAAAAVFPVAVLAAPVALGAGVLAGQEAAASPLALLQNQSALEHLNAEQYDVILNHSAKLAEPGVADAVAENIGIINQAYTNRDIRVSPWQSPIVGRFTKPDNLTTLITHSPIQTNQLLGKLSPEEGVPSYERCAVVLRHANNLDKTHMPSLLNAIGKLTDSNLPLTNSLKNGRLLKGKSNLGQLMGMSAENIAKTSDIMDSLSGGNKGMIFKAKGVTQERFDILADKIAGVKEDDIPLIKECLETLEKNQVPLTQNNTLKTLLSMNTEQLQAFSKTLKALDNQLADQRAYQAVGASLETLCPERSGAIAMNILADSINHYKSDTPLAIDSRVDRMLGKKEGIHNLIHTAIQTAPQKQVGVGAVEMQDIVSADENTPEDVVEIIPDDKEAVGLIGRAYLAKEAELSGRNIFEVEDETQASTETVTLDYKSQLRSVKPQETTTPVSLSSPKSTSATKQTLESFLKEKDEEWEKLKTQPAPDDFLSDLPEDIFHKPK